MIDSEGFRLNVGIVIGNRKGQVLWARRIRQNSWQFPQGGVNPRETPEEAMFRELYEELGLRCGEARIITSSKYWVKYKLPRRLVRHNENPVCIGQKQKWFLLSIIHEDHIEFNRDGHPEFDDWRWVSYWYPVRQVVAFKRDVYRRILSEFAPAALFQAAELHHQGRRPRKTGGNY